MSKKTDSDVIRLKDILTAIDDIEAVRLTKKSSKKDIHSAAFCITIIGEAANYVSTKLRKRHSEIPWRNMISMRNKIVHEYSGIDLNILLEVIEDDLPPLKKQIRAILKKVKE
jgi:uncharacterized protein with HEPN domain